MSTAQQILRVAKNRLGERYVFGARVPKDNAHWKGPWDCAEFVSWVVYQCTKQLYGCDDNNGRPSSADAYTGFWKRDALSGRATVVSVAQARGTPGSILLRYPSRSIGHIAFVDTPNRTVEAHSTNRGVIAAGIDGRRWDTGLLIPGVVYGSAAPVAGPPMVTIYRVTQPPMRGRGVLSIQRALKEAGHHPGPIDGIYGDKTEAAVHNFQLQHGIVVDGEVGPRTAALLGVDLA